MCWSASTIRMFHLLWGDWRKKTTFRNCPLIMWLSSSCLPLFPFSLFYCFRSIMSGSVVSKVWMLWILLRWDLTVWPLTGAEKVICKSLLRISLSYLVCQRISKVERVRWAGYLSYFLFEWFENRTLSTWNVGGELDILQYPSDKQGDAIVTCCTQDRI